MHLDNIFPYRNIRLKHENIVSSEACDQPGAAQGGC